MSQVVGNAANSLGVITAIQEAMTTNETFVAYDYTDTTGKTTRFTLPSYDAIMNRLKAVEESINALQTGRGTVNLADGSRRTVQLNSIPHTPPQITGLEDPSTFTLDSNWFFEELMFPGARVSVDLTGQIEDSADRVRVSRIILDADSEDARTLWQDDLSVNNYDYVTLKTLLSNNGVRYYEDEETVELPLVSNTAQGLFQITTDPEIKDGKTWYRLDVFSYATVAPDGTVQGDNNTLGVDDKLSYRESIYQVVEVDQNNLKVRLKRISGVDNLGAFSILNYFQDPFRSKTLEIRFGAHEYNIIYFKGIAEAHNLLANEWSDPIKFSSDELVLAGSTDLQNTRFVDYYNRYIVDWGAEMIAEAKEASISAWHGTTPNAPVLNGNDLRVVQINSQINAAIDTTDVKNIAAEIESVKSQISSLKSTIAAQKTDLQSAVNNSTYDSIQQQISTNTNDLKNLQTQYTSLVESFQGIVRENSAVTTLPKYHIRGFFPVPEYKYTDDNETIAEEIIGFDIAYRYIREDNTGVPLATYSYTNTDGTEITGTFSDWNIVQSPMKTKIYDNDLGRYIWRSENVADGSEVNINQIDIPINKGEKVEIKVRSISEAGYPKNPLRSVWSNSITMDFPDTLATGNEIADLITKVNDDALQITIDNTLDSVGVTAHLADTVPNTASVTGTYYKHLADNIAYEDKKVTGEDGATSRISMSVQEKIESLEIVSDDSSILIAKNTSDISAINQLLDEKIEQFETNISDLMTGLSQTDSSVRIHDIKFNKILDSDYNIVTRKVNFISHFGAGAQGAAYDQIIGGIGTIDGYKEMYIFGEYGTEMSELHLSDLIVHYDPLITTSSKYYSLNDKLSVIDGSIGRHDASIIKHENYLRGLNDSSADWASKIKDVSRLEEAIEDLSVNLYTIKDAHDTMNIFADDLTVGYPAGGTRLTANKMSGQMYIFDSGSDEQLGDLHLADLLFYNGGTIGGEITKLSDLIEKVNDTANEFAEVKEEYEETKSVVDKMLQFDGVNTYTVYANEIEVEKEIRSHIIVAEEYQVSTDKGFWAIHSEATGNVVSGNFSNVFLYATDGTIGSQSAPTSGTNRVNVLERLLADKGDIEDISSWKKSVESILQVDEYGASTTVSAEMGDFNEVKAIAFTFKENTAADTDYHFQYYSANIALMKDEAECADLIANDFLIRNTPGEVGYSVKTEIERLSELNNKVKLQTSDISNGMGVLLFETDVVVRNGDPDNYDKGADLLLLDGKLKFGTETNQLHLYSEAGQFIVSKSENGIAKDTILNVGEIVCKPGSVDEAGKGTGNITCAGDLTVGGNVNFGGGSFTVENKVVKVDGLDLTDLKKRYDHIEEVVTNLEATYANLEKLLSNDILAAIQALQAQVSSIQSLKLENMGTKVATVDSAMNGFQSQLNGLSAQISNLQDQINNLS